MIITAKSLRLVLLLAVPELHIPVLHAQRYAESTPFLTVVLKYADTMIEKGRDRYGKQDSPLFSSSLLRPSLQIGRPADYDTIQGVAMQRRSLGGANLLYDAQLYEILYKLSAITGRKKYAREADKALRYFLKNCQHPATGLFAWGEHLFWNFESDKEGFFWKEIHEAEFWPLWDRFYQLNPNACWRFTLGEWDHQIADKKTGNFSRHASWSEHRPSYDADFPRYAGQMIERWADAYKRKENRNRNRKGELLLAITTLAARMERNMGSPSGHLIAHEGADYVWPSGNLELARCLFEASSKLDREEGERLKELALKQDKNFLKAPHEVLNGGGFAETLHAVSGIPRTRSMNRPFTSLWSTGYGYVTHANTANRCYERYQQLRSDYPDLAEGYKTLILSVARQYLTAAPDTSAILKPELFSDVIALMINAYSLTGNKDFLERGAFFGKTGVCLFLNDGCPLPKATNRHNHYESATGGPGLMYRLLTLAIMLNQSRPELPPDHLRTKG